MVSDVQPRVPKESKRAALSLENKHVILRSIKWWKRPNWLYLEILSIKSMNTIRAALIKLSNLTWPQSKVSLQLYRNWMAYSIGPINLYSPITPHMMYRGTWSNAFQKTHIEWLGKLLCSFAQPWDRLFSPAPWHRPSQWGWGIGVYLQFFLLKNPQQRE